MTTIRIEPLAADGQPDGEARCRVRVRLTDARGNNLIGLRTTDGAPVTAFYWALIPAGGSAVELGLTPQNHIATPDGAPTYYQVELRASHAVQSWQIQVPDSIEVQDLMTLVGAAAIDPADIVAGRLLPDPSEEPDNRWVTTSDGAWTVVDAPPGIPDAPLTDGPYGRQGGAWVEAVGPAGPEGPEGPAGPSAVSADADNLAELGSDSLIYVPASLLDFEGDTRVFGFLPGNAETTLSFNDSTYTLTLTPTGSEWSYYRAGVKCTITGAKQVVLPGSPPTTGKWFVYINADDGTLSASQTPWTLALSDDSVPVAMLYWNPALTPKYLLFDERHPADISRGEHAYLHLTRGAQYSSGGVASGYTLQGSTDANNTLGISAGVMFDETLRSDIPAVVDPDGSTPTYLCLRRDGSGGWVWALSEVPFLYAPADFIQYDTGSGTLSLGANNSYYNSWVLMTPAGYHVIQPQRQHGTLAAAETETFQSLTLTGLFTAEYVAVLKLTWRTGSSYTTKGKARLEAVNTIQVTSIPAVAGTVTAATVPVSATPTNYTAAQANVEAHLAGMDTALGGLSASDHNHSGVYDPAGTGASEAASAVGGHESTYSHALIGSAVQPADLEDLDLVAYTEDGSTSSIQSSGTISLDLDGGVHEHTLSANVTTWTLTPPTAPKCGSVVVVLVQAAGAYTVAYPATWYWPDADEIVMPTASGDRLELVLRSTPSGAIFASANVMAQV